MALVELRSIEKTYFMKGVSVGALCDLSLDFEKGEFVCIMGPSGSGKSTLLAILGCLDRPTKGTYTLAGQDVSLASDDRLSDVRNRDIGFIFQSFNLIQQLTVLENVEVPLFYQGSPRSERRDRASEILAKVGLGDRTTHRPGELSGGQQQRVAIARALVTSPAILMADEPTGNLDSATGFSILALIDELHAGGLTIIMVTHDDRIAARCERVVRLRDGVIERDERGGGSRGRDPSADPTQQLARDASSWFEPASDPSTR